MAGKTLVKVTLEWVEKDAAALHKAGNQRRPRGILYQTKKVAVLSQLVLKRLTLKVRKINLNYNSNAAAVK